jgi:DNA polymerase-3 subunit gamma/tau
MSYTALARKWRPKSFEEMSGQEHVLRGVGHPMPSSGWRHAVF